MSDTNKPSWKYQLTLVSILLISAGLIFVLNNINNKDEEMIIETKTTDCSKPFSVIYLKPDEVKHSSNLMNQLQNTFIVIPETNGLRAKTEYLECDSFIYEQNKIMDMWGWNN